MQSARTMYWVGAMCAAAALAAPIVAPRIGAIWPHAESEPSRSPDATIVGANAPTAAQPAPSTNAQPAPASAPAKVEDATAGPPAPVLERPGFDVVRVDPTGETVVAGHSTPNAAVELRDGGRVIAKIVADNSGQFVILPPALAEGRHKLELAARSGGASDVVSDAVAVEVAAPKPVQPRNAPPAPKVAAATPAPQPAAPVNPPATVAALVPPKAAEPPLPPKLAAAPIAPAPSALPASGSPRVFVRTVEATEVGNLSVTGSAEANAIVRLYLNGSFVADASAGPDQQWSLTIEHGMAPGLYTIRADEVDRSSGAVLARAEVAFSYPQHPSRAEASLTPAAPKPAPVASATPSTPVPAPAPSIAAAPAAVAAVTTGTQAASAPTAAPAPSAAQALSASPATPANASTAPPSNVIVADLRITTVVRGDNLWDLARRFYGDGTRFRQIYAANANQIRNPSLIYIGQIFVVPKEPAH